MRVLLLLITLAAAALADPAVAPHAVAPKPAPPLPTIEIRASSPIRDVPAVRGPIELAPVRGELLEKMSVQGRVPWFGGYEMPAGPGRAWPNAAPPGSPVPAGGLLSPGFPGR